MKVKYFSIVLKIYFECDLINITKKIDAKI